MEHIKNIFYREELQLEKAYIKYSYFGHFFLYLSLFILFSKINIVLLLLLLLYTIYLTSGLLLIKQNRFISMHIYIGNIIFIFIVLKYLIIFNGSDIVQFYGSSSETYFFYILSTLILFQSVRLKKDATLINGLTVLFIYSFLLFYYTNLGINLNYKNVFISYTTFIASIVIGSFINHSKRYTTDVYIKALAENYNFTKDLNLANHVQESLFPDINNLKNIRCEVFRRSHKHVGGDFYDFIQLREGNLGIFIADVAGHGVSSAMIAAIIKVMVSSIPYYMKVNPEKLLDYLDKKIYENLSNHHATAIYLYINIYEKIISIANAGHPYLLYSKKHQVFYEIETVGTLIGYNLRSPVADSIHISYESGDRLFLFTDGLIECTNSHGKYLGVEGLIAILNDSVSLDIKELKSKIIIEIAKFRNDAEYTDDAMFLLFELQ